MKLYIVTAYRNGSRQAHSYPVGVFSTPEAAKACADTETNDTAGKYACFVTALELDVHIEEVPLEIYRTRSRMEERQTKIAGDLLREGEVTRVETFRIEMDAALGENTGDLKFEKNTDFEDGTM